MSVLLTLFAVFRSLLRSRAALELENLALRHQVNILKRSVKQPRLRPADRWLWVVLARVWKEWQSALAMVQPATVIAWHRKGFRLYWAWKIRRGKAGRPAVARSRFDPPDEPGESALGCAPHMHGELLKLGITIGETSVAKYTVRSPKPPSQTWRTFSTTNSGYLVEDGASPSARKSFTRDCS